MLNESYTNLLKTASLFSKIQKGFIFSPAHRAIRDGFRRGTCFRPQKYGNILYMYSAQFSAAFALWMNGGYEMARKDFFSEPVSDDFQGDEEFADMQSFDLFEEGSDAGEEEGFAALSDVDDDAAGVPEFS